MKTMNLSLIVLFSFLVQGCFAPPQNFEVNSELWEMANPNLLDLSYIEAHQKNHKVIIAVIDGGIDYHAPHLQKHLRLIPNQIKEENREYAIGWDFLSHNMWPSYRIIDPDNFKEMSTDLQINEHGTHVAQLSLLNQKKIGLIPIKALPLEYPDDSMLDDNNLIAEYSAQTLLSLLLEGIDFAVENGASIINMSLGMDFTELNPRKAQSLIFEFNQTIHQRFEGPWRDVILVAAAGNEGVALKYGLESIPASLDHPQLIAVGAVSRDRNEIASFSNCGPLVDIYAPGEDIRSLVPNRQWQQLSGTSMAAPLVTNLLARIKIEAPSLDASQVIQLLHKSSETRTLGLADQKNLETEDKKSAVLARAMRMTMPHMSTFQIFHLLKDESSNSANQDDMLSVFLDGLVNLSENQFKHTQCDSREYPRAIRVAHWPNAIKMAREVESMTKEQRDQFFNMASGQVHQRGQSQH